MPLQDFPVVHNKDRYTYVPFDKQFIKVLSNEFQTFLVIHTFSLMWVAQRDCRKTPSLKNVHKNLPQQAQKSPKCCPEHKKPGAFQCFCPTFQK
jgi:hypothetical protein